ncbi:MAG: hypothetical protein CMK94_02400 [Pseudomonas sp.]|nr:hypothetical protein [Pseudomonas sp.]
MRSRHGRCGEGAPERFVRIACAERLRPGPVAAAATAMPAIGKLLTHAAAHVGAVASAGQLCAKGWARGLPSMPATTCVHR